MWVAIRIFRVKDRASAADDGGMSMALVRRAPYPVRATSKRCAKCGKLVTRSTFACRRCGKRQRVRPRTILLVAALCFVGGMFAVASANVTFGGQRSGDAAGQSVDYAGFSPEGAALAAGTALAGARATELSAAQLWLSYTRDPAAADRLFKGKSLLVSGTVRSVDRDFDGSMLVRLITGDPFETVNARMAVRNQPQLLASKGKQVSLLCVGRGVMIGAPSLASCVLR